MPPSNAELPVGHAEPVLGQGCKVDWHRRSARFDDEACIVRNSATMEIMDHRRHDVNDVATLASFADDV
jgi:hypothetical protein